MWINTYHVFDAAAPFGGFKESGWGREMGHNALDNYLETKMVTVGRHERRQSPPGLVDRVLSISAVAALSSAEQRSMMGARARRAARALAT